VYLDIENDYYRLLLALLYYKNSQIEYGDSLLLESLNNKKKYNIEWLAKHIHPDKTTTLQIYVHDLKLAVEQGSIVAAYLLLLNDIYSEKSININYYKEVIESKSNSILGFDLFKSKLKELS